MRLGSVDTTDWSLERYENERLRREFVWAPSFSKRAGWDHDPCDLCWAGFSSAATDHAQFTAGCLTTSGPRQWVCPDCMDDFRVPLDLGTPSPG